MIHKEIDFNIGITNSSVLMPLSRYRNNGIINNLPDEKLPCRCEVKKESVLDQLKELRASDPAPPKDLAEQILERIRE